jgi:hypothetical protein
MKLGLLKNGYYINVSCIRDISINEGKAIPDEADPELFQYFVVLGFDRPVFGETEKAVWIGNAHQKKEAVRLLGFLIDELTDESVPIVDLRPERFDREFVGSL